MTRRGLLKLLPALAHYCHVMPWHIDPDPPVLTFSELGMFIEFLPTPKEDD